MMIKYVLMNAVLLVLVYDTLLWSAHLFRHSRWLKNHPRATGYCDRISYCMLAVASVFTGVFIAFLGIMWLWYKTSFGYNVYCYLTIIAVHTSTIHLFALLAHCTSLDVCYWPPVSKFVSIRVVQPIKDKWGSYVTTDVGDSDGTPGC